MDAFGAGFFNLGKCFFPSMLGNKPRASHLLIRCSAELRPQPQQNSFKVILCRVVIQ